MMAPKGSKKCFVVGISIVVALIVAGGAVVGALFATGVIKPSSISAPVQAAVGRVQSAVDQVHELPAPLTSFVSNAIGNNDKDPIVPLPMPLSTMPPTSPSARRRPPPCIKRSNRTTVGR